MIPSSRDKRSLIFGILAITSHFFMLITAFILFILFIGIGGHIKNSMWFDIAIIGIPIALCFILPIIFGVLAIHNHSVSLKQHRAEPAKYSKPSAAGKIMGYIGIIYPLLSTLSTIYSIYVKTRIR